MVRGEDGELHRTSWDEALDKAAAGFQKALDEHGRHSIYSIASGRTPSEANYTMQKFVRVGFGTHYIDNCSRAWHAPTVAGLAATIGRGAMSNPLADMEKPDVIFCIGTNMTECHPVAATRLKKAVARGAKMIVADPRRIRLAEMADIYLPIRVGTDVPLLLAMAHVIAREELLNTEFVQQRTVGMEDFIEHVKQFTPEWAAEITGVPAEDIEAYLRCG